MRADFTTIQAGTNAAEAPGTEEGLNTTIIEMVRVHKLHTLRAARNAPTP